MSKLLFAAVRADDPEAVRKALRRVKDVNRKDRDGYTALDLAVRQNRRQVVPILLDAGADPHGDYAGRCALARAADAGLPDLVRDLLALVEWRADERVAALDAAAQRKRVDILDALPFEPAGAAEAAKSAAMFGHADVMRWCMAKGVDPNLVKQAGGQTATLLHLAAGFARAAVVPVLVEAGADVDARNDRGRTPLMVAAEVEPRVLADRPDEEARFDEAEREGRVIWAAARGDKVEFTVIDALLAAGADATAVDDEGHDALAVLQGEFRRFVADDFVPEDDWDRRHQAPPREAAAKLRAAGARGLNPADEQLFAAVRAGDADGIRAALAAGASLAAIDATTPLRGTPLALAASKGDVPACRLLLDAGADPDAGGSTSRPLIRAAHVGHLGVVELLVARGADPNLPEPARGGGRGLTALELAQINGQREVVAYLKSLGVVRPPPSEPFVPGVEFPGTFTELLVRAPGRAVADALAAHVRGGADHDVLDHTLVAGRRGYLVVRLDGSEWTSVMGHAGCGRIIDDAWRDAARALSDRCQAPAVLLCYEKVSGSSAYEVYDRGQEVEHYEEADPGLYEEITSYAEESGDPPPPERLRDGVFWSRRDRPRPARMDHGGRVLQDLATAERFTTFLNNPGGAPGAPFDFSFPGDRRAIAETAYVRHPPA